VLPLCLVLLFGTLFSVGAAQDQGPPPEVLRAIREEVLRGNDDPTGRPLPVAAHWHSGNELERLGATYQLELIRKGHHVLPSVNFPRPIADEKYLLEKGSFFQRTLTQLAEWNLPFTLKGTQWEQELYQNKLFWELPPETNPNVIKTDGTLTRLLSPFGPVEPWKQVGKLWTGSPMMDRLQNWYPDPPRVFFLSNNEASKLRWAKRDVSVEISKRYQERYGANRDDDVTRKVVAEGWIERYRAMHDAMRGGLSNPAWRARVDFVGYEAFGPPHFGRWHGWLIYSLYTPGRVDPRHLMWDGGSPSYYTHNWNPSTDFKVWSPQIESMNWVFMQEEVSKETPDYWFEISVWDGSFPDHEAYDKERKTDQVRQYRKQGQEYTPARYAGFVQFGMWLLTPRAVREFRLYLDTQERVAAYFEALVAAVDRVHETPVLTRFWRKGKLVANRLHEHPYQTAVPEEYRDVDRWFLLDTSLGPRSYRNYSAEIPVFSLARVLGELGGREWLLYSHSPLKARKNVEVLVPGFSSVSVDVAVGGSFHHIKEKDRSVREIAESKPSSSGTLGTERGRYSLRRDAPERKE